MPKQATSTSTAGERGRPTGTGKVRRPYDADASRADLLHAARLRFARDGYDGASLRDIAADADVNLALISRYFGSKEGLFVEAIVDDDQIREMREVSAAELPAKMLARMLNRPDSYGGENPVTALLRSSNHPDIAERLRRHLDEDLTSRMTSLTDRPDGILRADLYIALLVGIGVLRTLIRKQPLTECTFEELWPHVSDVLNTLMSSDRKDASPRGETLPL